MSGRNTGRPATTAERELREREKLLRAVIDAEPECVKLLDGDGRLLLMNPSGLAMIEADSFEQVRGRDAAQLVVPEQREAFRELTRRVLRGGSGSLEFEAVGLKGRRVLLETRAVPLRDEDGGITAVVAVTRDVTERRRMERALRASEAEFKGLFEASPVSLWLEDLSEVKRHLDALRAAGIADLAAHFAAHPEAVAATLALARVLDVNQATVELFRAPSKEAFLAGFGETFTQETLEGYRQGVLALAHGEGTCETESVFKTLTGDRLYGIVKWSVVPGHEGDYGRVVVSITDITKRRRAEELVRAAGGWLGDQTGEAYLKAVTAFVARELEMAFALVGELVPGTRRILTRAAHGPLGPVAAFEYELAGTPCEKVVDREACFFPRGVQERFPHDTMLVDMGVRSYAAIPLTSAAGESLGHIAVCGTQELAATEGERLLSVLRLFAARAAAEIERCRAEVALRESAERYHDLFENAGDPIFILDERHRYVDANRRAIDLFGYGLEKLRGRAVLEFVPREQAARSEAAFRELVARGSYSGFEGRMLTADGRWLDVEVSSSAIVRDGVFAGSRDIVRDVSERKRSEALIQGILETVDEGFIIVGPDYRVLSANRAFAAQAGLVPSDIVGRPCHEVSHGLPRPCHETGEKCVVQLVFQTGETVAAAHVHRCHSAGPLHVETKGFPMKDAVGAVTAVIVIVNDVTERRRLEDQLRQAQKMEAVGLLAGGVAHDFNNILTAIIGYGNLMEMKLPPEHPVRQYADQIIAAAARAATLTQSLLAFSRKQVVNPRPVDLNEVIGNVESLLRRLIGEDVRLIVDRSAGALTVFADPSQLEQVLMNLATNARDAMPQGGSLVIRTALEPAPEGEEASAVIRISDTGIGMDERTCARIFEPFFTTKELGRGTGLGLAIVYSIVRQSQGRIEVESAPGAGTTFTIRLPAVAARARREAVAQDSLRAQPGGSGTILVAEDDPALRGLMRTVLGEFGYEVIDARDGEEAVQVFAAHRDTIRLAVLDVIMPGRNGREVFEALRADRPDLKVLFMSGYSDNIIDEHLLRQEGCDFLSKPISPTDLLARIGKLLQS